MGASLRPINTKKSSKNLSTIISEAANASGGFRERFHEMLSLNIAVCNDANALKKLARSKHIIE